MATTALPVCESRAAVGSSARMATATDVGGKGFVLVLNADEIEEAMGFLLSLTAAETFEREAQLDVLADTERWEEIEALKDEADVLEAHRRQFFLTHCSDVLAFEMQPMMESSVVLPLPEGPMRSTTSPRLTVRSMPARASVVASP